MKNRHLILLCLWLPKYRTYIRTHTHTHTHTHTRITLFLQTCIYTYIFTYIHNTESPCRGVRHHEAYRRVGIVCARIESGRLFATGTGLREREVSKFAILTTQCNCRQTRHWWFTDWYFPQFQQLDATANEALYDKLAISSSTRRARTRTGQVVQVLYIQSPSCWRQTHRYQHRRKTCQIKYTSNCCCVR